jgi:cell wall-associated NlpC family hydrolase
VLAALAAAFLFAFAPGQTAAVRVPVANVWETPADAGRLPLDPHVWPTPAVTYSQRLSLVGRMPTQVLYGETVRVLQRRGGWTRIAVPDQPSPLDRRGYPGWIRSWQLGKRVTAPTVVVTARSTRLKGGTEVGFGSEVPRGSVPSAAVRKLPRTRADVVRSAKMFLGLHYLWGGLSSWGMDCSGLTWAAYRVHGITIPRDADAQFLAGRPVPLARAKPGDLVFYEGARPGHVAMLIGGGRMIEAPNSAAEVRVVPIRAGSVGVRSFF